MLTLEDCLDFTDLTKDEIDAIAEHEHLPEITAAALASKLIHSPDGARIIKRYIREDIQAARAHGDEAKAKHWQQVYTRFKATHPGR